MPLTCKGQFQERGRETEGKMRTRSGNFVDLQTGVLYKLLCLYTKSTDNAKSTFIWNEEYVSE